MPWHPRPSIIPALKHHHSHGRNSMPVPSLPKLGAPPAPARLRTIALEEHFGNPIFFMRDSKGRFDHGRERQGAVQTGEHSTSRSPTLLSRGIVSLSSALSPTSRT